MIVKAFEVNKKKFDKQNFFLVYGENEGLISDIKKSLVKKDKVRTKNFYMSDLFNNSKNVMNEFVNGSLFGDPTLIFLNNAEDKVTEKIIDLINLSNKSELISNSLF